MGITGWIVWSIGCVVLLASLGSAFSCRDPFARRLAARYAVLVCLGLVVTTVLGVSRLHLIWWIPVAFPLNLVAAQISIDYKSRRWLEQQGKPTGDNKPIGLWALVSLATGTGILDVLDLRTGRRILAKAEGDAFAKVYQSILLYIGVLVDICVDEMVKERNMRLVGIPWDEFDAKTEILTGIADALAPGSEDDEIPEDDELCVTPDAYQTYLTSFLRLTVAEYETSLSEASRGDGCRPVDEYAIAADQFIETVASIEGFGKNVRDARFLAALNRFTEQARICVQRSCDRRVRGRAITRSWD